MTDSTPVSAAEQEVLITRTFDAPRERVFRAWTDPDEVAAWYGPEHFDTPRERIRIDLRVGGRYELTMVQRGGGAELAIGYEILELVEPVHRPALGPDAPGRHAQAHGRARRVPRPGTKTRMTLSDGPYPPESRGHAEAGYNAAFDKLATLVAE